MHKTVLEMKNITKRFPGVVALDNVCFNLREGEVHALLGENGAGKSTLVKILAGIYSAYEGELYINGNYSQIENVKDAKSYGISVIHQELSLARNVSVAENIFMGREFTTKSGFVDIASMNKASEKILARLGSAINPRSKVSELTIAQQQIVEIAKALSENANIIVMDEPTAMLTKSDVECFFETIITLRKSGIAIIYISHRMDEIFTLADRVTVLRDGKYIGTKDISETDRDDLIKLMVGREIKQFYIKKNRAISEEIILEVKNLNTVTKLKNVSISLRKGEILGFSGLIGAGRTELARALFGIDKIQSGEIIIQGKPVRFKSPLDAIKAGLVLVPESRKDNGLVLIRDVGFNIVLAVLNEFMKGITTDRVKERRTIEEFFDKLSIRATNDRQTVNELSGGNQQKVVIAKWLATRPKILVLDEPTRGIDVGAKAEIYYIMNELAQSGVSIIMISSELPEVLNMSDRVYVMNNGEIAACVEAEDINQENIIKYALGVSRS